MRFCVLVAAILAVGAPAFGLSAASLRTLALVAACPLVMILIMRVMHAGSSNDAGQLKNDQDEQVRRR